MQFQLRDLRRMDGKIDRAPYFVWGLCLSLIKLNLDQIVTELVLGKRWSVFQYWVPGDVFGVLTTSPERVRLFLPLVLIALPFVFFGVALTARRLRSAGLPVALVLLFFVPMVNLSLFAVLSLVRARTEGEIRRPRSVLDSVIPAEPVGGAAFAILSAVVFTVGGTFALAQVMGEYGWGLFLGLPFFLGLFCSLVYGYRRPRRFAACLLVSLLAVLILAGLLLALAIEGAICIMMAAPIVVPLTAMGAGVGYLIVRARHSHSHVLFGVMLTLPLVVGAETVASPVPPLWEVRTAVEIHAPPEVVWRHVIAFAELPPPDELIFRAGVAHPLRAEIDGCGPGAIRRCIFSTGAFVEPITVWDEPRLLRFAVTAQPAPMQEWSPYPGLRPPHLHGYFVSRAGQFLLTRLPGGRTRLEGTTWYTHDLWPSAYWGLWSDRIIHAIHMRVLRHIKACAEREYGR